MLGRAYLAFERWVRVTPARTARSLDWLPLSVLGGIARAKLARTLRLVWDRSIAERERWAAAGVRRRDLASPETLQRLPFITGEDLAARPADFHCAPERELVHLLSTSGTKGRLKNVRLTDDDFACQMKSIGMNYLRLPGASRGLAIFDVTNPTWCAGAIARRGFEAAGMFGLLAPAGTSAAELVDLIRANAVDTVIATPTLAHRVALEVGCDLRALGVKWLLLSGQPWPESLRAELEAAWGARAIDVYASTEFGCGVASECGEQSGLHLNEADLWAEAIDPATGRVLEAGEEGELVLTTLARRGMPLVRYRTGDLASLMPRGRCACGSPLRRMSRVRGRVDDMIILGAANNVYPDEFDRALFALDGVTDYQVVVEKDGGWRDVLRVTVEARGGNGTTPEAVERALAGIDRVAHSRDVEHTLAIAPARIVAPGALSAGRPKTNRIDDRRGEGSKPAQA